MRTFSWRVRTFSWCVCTFDTAMRTFVQCERTFDGRVRTSRGRVPIALYYFTSLHHDQAAAAMLAITLNHSTCPVGPRHRHLLAPPVPRAHSRIMRRARPPPPAAQPRAPRCERLPCEESTRRRTQSGSCGEGLGGASAGERGLGPETSQSTIRRLRKAAAKAADAAAMPDSALNISTSIGTMWRVTWTRPKTPL